MIPCGLVTHIYRYEDKMMHSPEQVDMVDNYLHLCEGGVFLPIDFSPRDLEWLNRLAREKGMTAQGYLTSIVPRLLEIAEEVIAKDVADKAKQVSEICNEPNCPCLDGLDIIGKEK